MTSNCWYSWHRRAPIQAWASRGAVPQEASCGAWAAGVCLTG